MVVTRELVEGVVLVSGARDLMLPRAAHQDVELVHFPLGRTSVLAVRLLGGHHDDLPLLPVLGLARLVHLMVQLDVRIEVEVLGVVLLTKSFMHKDMHQPLLRNEGGQPSMVLYLEELEHLAVVGKVPNVIRHREIARVQIRLGGRRARVLEASAWKR